ncbi:heavy metal-responsive transcriptional regulator [Burkholderia aenigmatica]|uniref:heavy metal-responsive transcriptional regulator n=1 Tax=Burkholderia aenigmatica TaxID=2015348 RepID=UPI002655DE0E|nr:heavy metal-responsive transcriptional regulator [Burkholderia aenigmatica]MDN7876568.1 heavy metal-responsive transcriptional regulator [Burkholderia aenigmatica]
MNDDVFTIGRLATESGVSRDALRYYEREGLLAPVAKTSAGYRLYEVNAVRRIRFIQHAQRCGFTLAEIHELLDLSQTGDACCADVRQRAIDKLGQLTDRIRTMQAMAAALDELIAACTDGRSPVGACPILAALERAETQPDTESCDEPNTTARKETENGAA